MNTLRAKEDKFNLEQEISNGDYSKMKAVYEKRIQLYIERLMLSNKREWQMSHLLGLIENENMVNKLSGLTKRIRRLEEAIELEEE